MAVRTTMATLIAKLRQETASSVTEFSDQALQDILDQNTFEFRQESLSPTPTPVEGGTYAYLDYYLPHYMGEWFETPLNNVVNAYFSLQNTQYAPIVFNPAAVSYNAYMQKITFVENTVGDYFYLTAVSYDMYGAAAQVWNIKAANRVGFINIKTDNHTLGLEDEYQHCINQSRLAAGRSMKNSSGRIVRVDQAGSNADYRVVKGFAPVGY